MVAFRSAPFSGQTKPVGRKWAREKTHQFGYWFRHRFGNNRYVLRESTPNLIHHLCVGCRCWIDLFVPPTRFTWLKGALLTGWKSVVQTPFATRIPPSIATFMGRGGRVPVRKLFFCRRLLCARSSTMCWKSRGATVKFKNDACKTTDWLLTTCTSKAPDSRRKALLREKTVEISVITRFFSIHMWQKDLFSSGGKNSDVWPKRKALSLAETEIFFVSVFVCLPPKFLLTITFKGLHGSRWTLLVRPHGWNTK